LGLSRDSFRYRAWCALIGIAGSALLRLLAATWRVRFGGPDPFDGNAFVGSVWHRDFLPATILWRDRNAVVTVSRSRDGDLIDAVLSRLGFAESARGSSSKGGTSMLRSLVRRLRAGSVVGVVADGPRGPAFVAKPGGVALARLTGAPLIPACVGASPRIPIGSWDQAFLPFPFARVVCRYGSPLEVPMDATHEQIEDLTRRLENEMTRLDREIEAELRGG